MNKSKKVVLLIDDNPLLNKLYSREISKQGFEVLIAYNGKEALSLIKEHFPDAVILDLYMPGMGGIELLKEIRNDPKTKDLKVVVLTISAKEEDKNKAKDLGVCDYLIKSDLHLDDVVKKVLSCI